VKSISFPAGCITANNLRALARAMDRLNAWHTSAGGQMPDVPCLKSVVVYADTIEAHVTVGQLVTFKLKLLHDGSWELL
jgi:hypothetical protein